MTNVQKGCFRETHMKVTKTTQLIKIDKKDQNYNVVTKKKKLMKLKSSSRTSETLYLSNLI